MANSSDLVKHIRTVHFTLLLACFADRAYTQLETVREVISNWNDWWNGYTAEEFRWLKLNEPAWSEPGPAAIFLQFPHIDNSAVKRHPEVKSGRTYWEIELPSSPMQLIGSRDDPQTGKPENVFLKGTGSYNFAREFPPPHTLAEFRDFRNEPMT
jgi:hypothetical protein